MNKITGAGLALLAALALPAALVAQTTETPPADQPADQPQVTPDGLALGTEIAGSDKIGSTYTAATFEAWEQRCVRTESGVDPCQLYMLVKDAEGNATAEFTIFGLPVSETNPAAAGGTFIAPLETLLTAGLMLQVDAGTEKGYPFTFCTDIGCIARLGFTPEEVAEMKAGAAIRAVIVPFVAPDDKVELTISLKGFTAGLEAVDAANDAADAAAAAAAAAAPAETAPAAE
ncbi:MAG: hypothetical protein B7Z31_08700 [Rhodobacterales bacterium 12-65-15]|nr:MAG: hypothetical protein B7Z31_08700 [Rhodobacterales bacterium 12-65-15]